MRQQRFIVLESEGFGQGPRVYDNLTGETIATCPSFVDAELVAEALNAYHVGEENR